MAPKTPQVRSRQYGQHTLTRPAGIPTDSPNVLFLALDDCNDWPGFLRNHPGTHTPNLDALAAQSLSFTQAYCTAPICKPARNGVLFGQHPFENGVYDHYAESTAAHERFMEEAPSLIDDFWAAGYSMSGAGKVFHDGQSRRWSEYQRTPFYLDVTRRDRRPDLTDRFDPDWTSPYDGEPIGLGERFSARMLDFGPSGRPPELDPDGVTATWVRQRLVKRRRRPLFLAYGLVATHVPWRVPQRFFDLHPLEEVVVPEIRPDELDPLPGYARDEIVDIMRSFEHLRQSGRWAAAVQAYQAAMSYMDFEVGVVLDALHSGPYADDTIVALWSDHGFHLGEKLHLHKFTLWEQATRVPLLLHVPGRFDRGRRFERPVSTIDLGPTLAELCGVRIHGDHRGRSMLPLVARPQLADDRPAITTWQERNHAVRRGPWRYIRYRTAEAELYDHRSDPDERVNLAGRPEHRRVQAELDRALPPLPWPEPSNREVLKALARHGARRARRGLRRAARSPRPAA